MFLRGVRANFVLGPEGKAENDCELCEERGSEGEAIWRTIVDLTR